MLIYAIIAVLYSFVPRAKLVACKVKSNILIRYFHYKETCTISTRFKAYNCILMK